MGVWTGGWTQNPTDDNYSAHAQRPSLTFRYGWVSRDELSRLTQLGAMCIRSIDTYAGPGPVLRALVHKLRLGPPSSQQCS
jgi:hypothetical protein